MLLSSLIGADVTAPAGAGDIEVAGITADSRACARATCSRRSPAPRPTARASSPTRSPRAPSRSLRAKATEVARAGAVPVLRAREPRRALALMAARFSGAQPETVVAVTGTSGKTSVAEFTRQIFAALGHAGRLARHHRHRQAGRRRLRLADDARSGDAARDAGRARATKASRISRFEASSHGLDQHRLDGVRLTAAAFTNLGRDHLDYHPTIEAYLAAKLRLFSELLPPGAAGRRQCRRRRARRRGRRGRASARPRVMTVGARARRCGSTSLARDGFAQRMAVAHAGRSYDVRLPLLGAYQASNALVAAGLAIADGRDRGPRARGAARR